MSRTEKCLNRRVLVGGGVLIATKGGEKARRPRKLRKSMEEKILDASSGAQLAPGVKNRRIPEFAV